LMTPANLARLIINGLQHGLRPDVPVAAAPTLGFAFGCQVKLTEYAPRADVKQARLRIETRRQPVGCAIRTRFHQASVWFRFLCSFGNRPSLLVDARCPVSLDEGRGQQVFAGSAIQDEEVTVPV